MRNVTVTGVTGMFLDFFVKSRLTSIVTAIMAAKGNVVANPQPWVWGFMTLSQTHINRPMYGSLKKKGREPKTIRVTRMSRI